MTRTRLRVDPSGGGDAKSLGQALALLPDPPRPGGASIFLEAGVYREKNSISYPGLRIAGAGMDVTKLVWGDYARMPGADGRPIRTFSTSTLLLCADGAGLSDLAVINDSGWGEAIGQAIALYADADLVRAERCLISARQDSLFLGPLPPTPIEGKDFGGPRDGLPRRVGRQLYLSCRIEGDVDFIFGSAQALFLSCRIVSLDRPGLSGPRGYIAAPSSPADSRIGFLFSDCSLEAGPGLPEESVFLARPWRDDARAVFHRCSLGRHIKRELWDDWGKAPARAKSFFACAGCFEDSAEIQAPAAPGRRPWEKTIDREGLASAYAAFELAFPGLDLRKVNPSV